MKQLLFLLLFPCLALAQYQGNANQKITLGEQTTADGLVFRGVASIDTVTATSKITRANKQDTSAYLLLDTVTNLLWHYKIGSNAWIQAGGGVSVSSFSAGTTGLTPSTETTGAVTLGGTLAVANGGTNTSSFAAGSVIFAGQSGTSLTQDNSNLFFDNANDRLGIGTTTPVSLLDVNKALGAGNQRVASFFNSTGNGFIALGTNASSSRGALLIYDDTNNYFGFRIIGDGTSAGVNIRDGGNVGIGTTTPASKLEVAGSIASKFASTDGYIALQAGGPTVQGYFEWFKPTPTRVAYMGYNAEGNVNNLGLTLENSANFIISGGNVGIGTATPQSGYKLHVVDSVYVGGRVSAAGYTTRSDYNLKDEIQTLNYGLNEVIQMQPVKYTYKSNGEQQLGFIAQDIGTLIPESVHFDEFMGVDYQSLIPILTKAIQEQQALIKALEQRILILENK